MNELEEIEQEYEKRFKNICRLFSDCLNGYCMSYDEMCNAIDKLEAEKQEKIKEYYKNKDKAISKMTDRELLEAIYRKLSEL